MTWDVAIVGAGPAGLSSAIAAAQAGLSVIVLEREALPHDKPCGEGLMPTGRAALARLGVELTGAEIEGIRYVQEDGSFVEGRLEQRGLGVRRPVLSQALHRRAEALGIEVRQRTRVLGHRRERNELVLELGPNEVRAHFLVAADGLHSPIRRREGLDAPEEPVRFGFRQHFACAPWSSFVEVHLSEHAEAYVTPVSAAEVGVAVLFSKHHPAIRRDWRSAFPVLQQRLGGSAQTSLTRGAGPFRCRARRVIGERLALVGDAAGYVDAITGEGVSLSLEMGLALGTCLPNALDGGLAALAPYERAWTRAFKRYAFFAQALVALAGRPALRRGVLGALQKSPSAFEWMLQRATRSW